MNGWMHRLSDCSLLELFVTAKNNQFSHKDFNLDYFPYLHGLGGWKMSRIIEMEAIKKCSYNLISNVKYLFAIKFQKILES